MQQIPKAKYTNQKILQAKDTTNIKYQQQNRPIAKIPMAEYTNGKKYQCKTYPWQIIPMAKNINGKK